MVAVLRPDVDLIPMTVDRLNEVMNIEHVAYPFPWTRSNFCESLDAGYSAWLLLHQSTLIGYGVFMLALDEAHLLNLTVAPSYQSQGYGRYLLTALSDIARQHGATRMFLEVRPSNMPARRLYQHGGFATVGMRRAYYPDIGGRREDAIVMERSL